MLRRIERTIPLITLVTVGTTMVIAVSQILWGLRTSSPLLCVSALFNKKMNLSAVAKQAETPLSDITDEQMADLTNELMLMAD